MTITTLSLIKSITNLYDFKKYMLVNYPNTQGILYEENMNYLEITFTQDITTDISTINTLINNYQNISSFTNYSYITLDTTYKAISSTSYMPTYTYIHKGQVFDNVLSSINVLCFLQPNTPDDSNLSTFNYSFQVQDITNNIVLGSITGLTNSTLQKVNIPLTLISNEESWIQIFVKKDISGMYVSIFYVELVFNS